jgi:hypothetical protein
MDSRITDVLAWDPVDSGGPPCGLDQVFPNAKPPFTEICARWPVGRSAEILSTLKANLLIFGGNTGGALSCDPEGFSHFDFFKNTPETTTSLHIVFGEAEHLDWRAGGASPLTAMAEIACDASGKPGIMKLVHQVTKRTNVAWLLKFTKGMSEADEYLDSNSQVMAQEINNGALSMEWK